MKESKINNILSYVFFFGSVISIIEFAWTIRGSWFLTAFILIIVADMFGVNQKELEKKGR